MRVGQAQARAISFVAFIVHHGCQSSADSAGRQWSKIVRDAFYHSHFYQFPKEHWKHLRTTNPIESPFAALRLRTDAAKRYKKVENATAVIFKMLLLAEQRFRRLAAPERMMQVFLGVQFRDGIDVKQAVAQVLAA